MYPDNVRRYHIMPQVTGQGCRPLQSCPVSADNVTEYQYPVAFTDYAA